MVEDQENQQQQCVDEELVLITNQTYYFTLDDQRFQVDAKLLRDALHTTPKDPDHSFVAPSPHDDIVSFINKLGYPGSLDKVS
nr:hypothetical protein [Tanacetum cinerariifolium]